METKIAIHKAYGGFYSKILDEELLKIKKDIHEIRRDDSDLIRLIEDLNLPQYKIVSIPADVEWQIEEYDGKEWVAEVHRTWD